MTQFHVVYNVVMKVQKGRLPDSDHIVWMVLDHDYLPVQPILRYLRYLENLERSPNTLEAYARNLKLFWEFLQASALDWNEITIEALAEFIHWLRQPKSSEPIPSHPVAQRSEKTINHVLTTVSGFYAFQTQIGNVVGIQTDQYQFQPGQRYRPFLQGIAKAKVTETKLLKLKEPYKFPGCLTREQVQRLVAACQRQRDKFLICLLYDTGMRIGEALGLRHEDIQSAGKNEIHIMPRGDSANGARSKSLQPRTLHVSKALLKLYSNYLIDEYLDSAHSDYVFVNLWQGDVGTPMKYPAVSSLFRRLQKKTGIQVFPHLLRHTHATELIRAGWDMAHVQKRLGHSNVQTTLNTYIHLVNADLKAAYQQYLNLKGES